MSGTGDASQRPLDGPLSLQQNSPPFVSNHAVANSNGVVPPGSSGSGHEEGHANAAVTEGQRRRIARACDMCRKKKIKCDGKMPKCSHCINYKTECVFTQVEKKRNPPKGAKYIEGLENRLGRMESLLRLSGLLSEDEGGNAPDLLTLERRLADRAAANKARGFQGTTNTTNPPNPAAAAAAAAASTHSTPQTEMRTGSNTSGNSPTAPQEGGQSNDVEMISDMMCSLVTNSCGETRFIGSSSGFSIFSPRGIQWVNEKTGDTSFQEMIQSACIDDDKWMAWKPEIYTDIFARRVFKPLPPKDEAMSLLRDYFNHFNCLFPLFHEPTFMHLAERQYSRDPYEGCGWWASLNVVLAFAHRIRMMNNLDPHEENKISWLYMKNALAVLTELTLRSTDLMSIQALVGMALYMQGTPNPQPSFFLAAAAIRLSHSVGLHKRGAGFGLNPVEMEQRRRVFWLAYIIDKDLCLRSGRPPVQDDDDMNVELPSENPPDNVGNIPLLDGKGTLNLFRLFCRFAMIQSKVYRRLYSAKAARQSDGELLNTIGELDQELEEFKNSIPIEYRPEHEIKVPHPGLVLKIVLLHFSYYNCVSTIHRMSVHHGYWTNRLSDYAIQGLNPRPLNPRVFSSANICVSAARATINLLKYLPQSTFGCTWLILYYPVAAHLTLFANIIQNPQDPRARSDIKLMSNVVNFLNTLLTDEASANVQRMLTLCSEFVRIATVAVEKAEKESQNRRKRRMDSEAPAGPTNQDADATATSQPSPSTQQQPPQQRPAEQQRQQQQQQHPPPAPQLSAPPAPSRFHEQGHLPPEQNGGSLSQQPDGVDTAMSDAPAPDMRSMSGFSPDFQGVFGSTSNPPEFTAQTTLPGATAAAMNPSFAHSNSFVPQDLWQMPMTLEWDWAEMSGFFPNMDQTELFDGSLQTGP